MPVVNLKVNISGLSEIAKVLSPTELAKQLTAGLVDTANALHKELAAGVKSRYAITQSINSVLIGKGASIEQIGNTIAATLAYKYKSLDLSQFPYSPKSIPRPPGYATHSVQVIRGSSKVVLGKSGNGGFVPRNKDNVAWRARDGKTRMFERVGRKRLPLRVLYGPSLSQMTSNVLTTNPTEGVSAIVDNLDSLLASKLEF